jgi:hypothetical protein
LIPLIVNLVLISSAFINNSFLSVVAIHRFFYLRK